MNLRIYGYNMSLEVDTDEEEEVIRRAGKKLDDTLAAYSAQFGHLELDKAELAVRVALEMACDAVEARAELDKINKQVEDLLSY